jgi:chromosome segregation ATPase
MKLRTPDEATSRLIAYQNEVAVLEKRAKEAESALAVAKTQHETVFQSWKRATARLEADLDKAVAERDEWRARAAAREAAIAEWEGQRK